MAAVAPSAFAPSRPITRNSSPIGADQLRHARNIKVMTGIAAKEVQDRERRRRNEDWSEEDTQYYGAGDTMPIFDIKESYKGRIAVLISLPKVRSGLKARLPGHW
jgi:hypothetical protein